MTSTKNITIYYDDSARERVQSQVTELCRKMAKHQPLVDATNTIFADVFEAPLTVDTITQADDVLMDALYTKYSSAPNKLTAFLEDLEPALQNIAREERHFFQKEREFNRNIPSIIPYDNHTFFTKTTDTCFELNFANGRNIAFHPNQLRYLIDDNAMTFSTREIDFIRQNTPQDLHYKSGRGSNEHLLESFSEKIAPVNHDSRSHDAIIPQFFAKTAERGIYYLSPEVLQLAEKYAQDRRLNVPSLDQQEDRDAFLIAQLREMEKDPALKAQIDTTIRLGMKDFVKKLLLSVNSIYEGGHIDSFVRYYKGEDQIKIPRNIADMVTLKPTPLQSIQFLAFPAAKQAFERQQTEEGTQKAQELFKSTEPLAESIATRFSESFKIPTLEEAIQPIGICYGKDYRSRSDIPVMRIVYSDPRMADVHWDEKEYALSQSINMPFEKLTNTLEAEMVGSSIEMEATQQNEDAFGLLQVAKHIGVVDEDTLKELRGNLEKDGIIIRADTQQSLFNVHELLANRTQHS
jgi:hypothetical protein